MPNVIIKENIATALPVGPVTVPCPPRSSAARRASPAAAELPHAATAVGPLDTAVRDSCRRSAEELVTTDWSGGRVKHARLSVSDRIRSHRSGRRRGVSEEAKLAIHW